MFLQIKRYCVPRSQPPAANRTFSRSCVEDVEKEGLIGDTFIKMILKWRHTSGISVHNEVRIKPYEVFNFEKGHGDEKIVVLQEWIERNYRTRIRVDSLARQAAMSRRTFERSFKSATGETPLQYLQRVRVDKAKMLLEQGDNSFEQITDRVGSEDSSSFRMVF